MHVALAGVFIFSEHIWMAVCMFGGCIYHSLAFEFCLILSSLSYLELK
jgi:hypothetical protein